jgi:cell division protein ZapD
MLLRVEFMMQQLTHLMMGESQEDSRAALQALFAILGFTAHNEIRSELIKELGRHASYLGRIKQERGVDTELLDNILFDIEKTTDQIHAMENQALDAVRKNDFLSAVRQRSNIPGGTCQFDLPALHHWLNQPHAVRIQQIQRWFAPFEPLRQAVGLILQLIRNSAVAREGVAVQGFFQQTLESSAPSQMVRVILPAASDVFAEISGGKHRFSIRFMEQSDPERRPFKTSRDIDFQLVCCII